MPNWSAAAVTLKLSPPVVWIGCNSVMTAWTPPTVNAPPPSTRCPGGQLALADFEVWVLTRDWPGTAFTEPG